MYLYTFQLMILNLETKVYETIMGELTADSKPDLLGKLMLIMSRHGQYSAESLKAVPVHDDKPTLHVNQSIRFDRICHPTTSQ